MARMPDDATYEEPALFGRTPAKKPSVGGRVTFTDGDTDRAGTVWSRGPQPASVWVVDDHGDPAVVKVPADGSPPYALECYSPQWCRDTVARCENLRRAARLVPVVDRTYRDFMDETRTVRTYHADPACADAAGKAADPDEQPRPAFDAIAQLLGTAPTRRELPLCRRCVYLIPETPCPNQQPSGSTTTTTRSAPTTA